MPARSRRAFLQTEVLGAETATNTSGYLRNRDLPRILPLWPNEISTNTLSDHLGLLARLRRALRSERQRGLGGHWAYDLARHAQLLRAYRAETAAYLAARGMDVQGLDLRIWWRNGQMEGHP